MIRHSRHLRLLAISGILACLGARPALANGRFPGANQLVIDPIDARHIVVRTTFGIVATRDGGAHWGWSCEEVVGPIGTADPPVAIAGDGTLVVGVPFDGVSVSHDDGCSWSRAPAPVAGQLVVDMTVSRGHPERLLLLTSTADPSADPDAAIELVNRVFETDDGGRTWTETGGALPRDFIATTLEVAPSDEDRIYVGGVTGDPPLAAIERSSDRGRTWTRVVLPVVSSAGAFVSGVDPRDADRLWVRAPSGPADAFGMAPTKLFSSSDQGSTWTLVSQTRGSMFGFALSPDGSRMAYGSEDEGVFIGPSSGGAFEQVSRLKNHCLRWGTEGLLGCGIEPVDPFAVGRWNDASSTFEAVYRVSDTCPRACPAESAFATVCRASWTATLTGVAAVTGATGDACNVDWAKVAIPDSGTRDAASNPAIDAGSADVSPETSGGCACRSIRPARGRSERTAQGAQVVAAIAALVWFIARRAKPSAARNRS